MYQTLLLVLPPQHALLEGFSSGLISLANFISGREPSVDVGILDLSYASPHEAAAELAGAAACARGRTLIAVTTTTATYQSALAVARAARTAAPGGHVVFGGHHASPEARIVLREHRDVDAVVCGEGETALLALVRNPDAPAHVPNLAYRDADGAVQVNPRAPLLTTGELDSIAPTYRGEGIRSARGKFDHVSYVSARGCPLRCAFCAVSSERIRAKSVERVAEDLRTLVKGLGYYSIAIEDNFFAHSPARTRDVCSALEELRREPGMDFNWDAQTRVESANSPDVLASMRRAGCEALYLGVESLVDEQLVRMRKTPEPRRYLGMLEESVVPRLLASDINCYVNLQLGLPGETQGERDATLATLRRLGRVARDYRKQITVFPMLSVIYPGTADYAAAAAPGQLLGGFGGGAFERFTEWEAHQKPVLTWLGRHFAHGTGGVPAGILDHAALRDCRFVVDPNRVCDVVNQLDEMRNVPGVRVFNYSKYIVAAPATVAAPAATAAVT
jgi:radical SAM superfamily enzyme YgiQ (UPF0313 family)